MRRLYIQIVCLKVCYSRESPWILIDAVVGWEKMEIGTELYALFVGDDASETNSARAGKNDRNF